MAPMNWSEEYSVDIISLDLQHQRIIELINQLERGAGMHQETKALGSVLSELLSYTKTHFKTEEALMRAHKYPGLASHEVEHRLLVNRVTEFRKKFEAGKLTDVYELVSFLEGWLESHILGTDKKYTPYLSGKGIR